MAFIWKLLFKMAGWKIEGGLPADLKKCIIVAAPHTSNWDFFYAIPALYLFKIKMNYLIKKESMVFPASIFLKRTGAIGVERKGDAKGLVDELAQKLKEAEELALVVAPEGTRKSVTKWKTGFYNIALKAELPIALSYLDYSKKIAGIGPVIYPTGDYQRDLLEIQEFYRSVIPKNPATYAVNIIQELEYELTKKLAPEA